MAKRNFSTFFSGFLIGVVSGLGIAAVAAMLITNAPMPFENKVQKVTADVDPASKLDGSIDPNKLLSGSETPDAMQTITHVKTVSAEDAPSRDAGGKAVNPGKITPVTYWVQTGAFRSADGAAQNQAALAMSAVQARIVKSRNGLWLVRVGPLDSRQEADEIQNMLNDQGMKTKLVKQ